MKLWLALDCTMAACHTAGTLLRVRVRVRCSGGVPHDRHALLSTLSSTSSLALAHASPHQRLRIRLLCRLLLHITLLTLLLLLRLVLRRLLLTTASADSAEGHRPTDKIKRNGGSLSTPQP